MAPPFDAAGFVASAPTSGLQARRAMPPRRVPVCARSGRDDAPASSPPRVSAGLRLLESSLNSSSLVRFARAAWHAGWLVLMNELAPSSADGSYARPQSTVRGTVAEGPGAPLARGRYEVYIGVPCPWCHRVTIARAITRADVDVVEVVPSDVGLWELRGEVDGMRTLRDVYLRYDPEYRGRFTAPLLVDKVAGRLVNNESADIVSILSAHTSGPSLRADSTDAAEMETLNAQIQTRVNNGVYACGFAKTQVAYDGASAVLFGMLDYLEARLARGPGPYLLGAAPSEADVRLFPTLIRFDYVYAPFFKCHARSIRGDYPHLFRWMQHMYREADLASTIDLARTQRAYYFNLFPLNAGNIVPAPPPSLDHYLARNTA